MKYFIDFEASQYTQEIISVGCVSETNNEFYSLINTRHKIGNFVSHLTGLTDNDFNEAKNADTVFKDLFYWVDNTKNGEKVEFFCYGNADTIFALNSLKALKYSFYAQAILSLIITSTVDYADHVKAKFGLQKHISLIKVAQYFSQETLSQTHNALEDAKMLQFVYNQLQQGEKIADNPFPEYMQRIEQYDENNNLVNIFFGLEQAASSLKMPKNANPYKIKHNIIRASEEKTPYCGFKWIMVK